jgi:hypothetical protein
MEKDDYKAKMMFSVIFLHDDYKGTFKNTIGSLSARAESPSAHLPARSTCRNKVHFIASESSGRAGES